MEPQGRYEPIVCFPGYYCPAGGQQLLLCPETYYCPLGAITPLPCDWKSACPTGSARQFPLVGLVFLAIVDLALVAGIAGPFVRRLWRQSKKALPSFTLSLPDADSEKAGTTVVVEDKGSYVTESATAVDLQRFVKSLTRCIGLNEIGLEIGFERLGFQLKKGQQLLKGVSGTVKRGSLLAVMGSSGAGKSTFVRVLMGKLKHTSGAVYINGVPKGMAGFKKIIGYVPQDDVVLPELTVRENLLHSARVRLPRPWTESEFQTHIDILISCLQLTHIQHSPVGDIIKPTISGGQRKRVSIGIELAAAPMALVLDEPTSGLDATSALSIIEMLKALCRLGVTVVCIIHQPRMEIFQSLDRLLLLANGQEVFVGEAAAAVDHFKTAGYDIPLQCNPADAIMDIISGQGQKYRTITANKQAGTISQLIAHWKAGGHQYSNKASDPKIIAERNGQLRALSISATARGAPWYRQVYFCFLRSTKQQSRQLTGFFLEIGVAAIAGLLLGLSVYKLEGLLFQGVFLPPFELLSSAVNYTLVPELGLLCSLAIGLAAAAPGVKTFGEEKSIYWREASAGHSRSAYFVGKGLSTLFRLTLSALHFTVFFTVLATPLMPFGSLYAANLLYFYCIYGLACCVSMITRREDGPLLAMIVSLIIGIFGGYGPSLSTVKSWHLEWAWRMCPGVSVHVTTSPTTTPNYLCRPGFPKHISMHTLRPSDTSTTSTWQRLGLAIPSIRSG